MNKPLSKADKTRQLIIQKMASVFNRKGFAGTSMSDVEITTGMSRGGIYGAFENKELMALAAFDYNFDKICRIVSEETKKVKSFEEQLMVYGKVYRLMVDDEVFYGGSPLLNTASEADNTNALLKERVSKALTKKEKSVRAILELGVFSGEFKKQIKPDKIAHTIISMLEGGLMMSRATGNPSAIDNVIKQLDELLNGIRN